MPTALLPLLCAAGISAGAVTAYDRPPLSQHGEAYTHVPMHLVGAGAALLLALAVLSLADRARVPRARRAARWCALAWGLTAGVLALEAYGATIRGGYGENSLHGFAAMALLPAAAMVLVTGLLVLLTRGSALPWPLRLVLLISVPVPPALAEAGSAPLLTLCLVVALGWAAVGVHALAGRPDRVPAAA